MRTIVNLVDQIGHEFDFRIITSDRDLGDTVPYSDVTIDQWNVVDKAQVFYVSPGNQTIAKFAALIGETPHDILYLNSFFDPVFTIRPLLARRLRKIPQRPTIIAPRGEFSDGALALKKWKKAPYMAITKVVGLYNDLIWQASSDYEACEIRRATGAISTRLVVAPNAPPLHKPMDNVDQADSRKASESLRVCFLSRISPNKNLNFSLRILAQVAVPVIFDIYGPKEDESYWEVCESLIKKLPSSVTVHYQGSVEHHRVIEVFRNYDLFLFPTYGENYGHVILESMLAGTPVLLANTTPWRNLETLGVGWDLSLNDPDAFIRAIEKAASLDIDEYVSWREHVRDYAVQVTCNYSVLKDNKQLFLNAVK